MSRRRPRPPPDDRLEQQAEAAAPAACRNPWERRADLGWARAFGRAAGRWVVSPKRAFDATRRRGGFRDPFLFAFLVCLLATLGSELTDGLYRLGAGAEGSKGLGELFDLSIAGDRVDGLEWIPATLLSLLSAGGCALGLLIGVPVLLLVLPVILLLWSGLLHLCLGLVGGLRRSQAGFQGTWAAICYASVGFFGDLVPVVGEWISFWWLGLLQGIGFWRLHRTPPIRAAAALLLPFAVVALLWLARWLGWIAEGDPAGIRQAPW